VLKEGDWVSVDGTTGDVIVGQMAVRPPAVSGDLASFLALADARRRLKVFCNADTPEDSAVARQNGAEGTGLVRTEHCFFQTPERISAVRRLIVGLELGCATTASDALAAVEAFQTADFEGIFVAMDGLPVTIRCLDPPLGEFLPAEGSPALRELCERLAGELPGKPCAREVEKRLAALHEVNPMLGLRGAR
jgi:pyruvate, orthophosphate dikinase